MVVAVPPGEEGAAAGWGAGVRGRRRRRDPLRVGGGGDRSWCETELVVVHDAARPLVTAELIDAVVEGLAARDDSTG